MAKKKTSSTTTSPRSRSASSNGAARRGGSSRRSGESPGRAVDASGKHLVIVESPSKARNINQYLGPDYVVKASVGHVRDLPTKAPKGSKQPVPGVDLEHDFEPTYEILDGKKSTVTELKKLARSAADVWFATDLDREGEAIAWHLAQVMGISPDRAKRVVFNAVTRSAIQQAFQQPHPINENRVNAQQARRILDRIVGYQVSPFLWRKVARGLSAGRVQSVAVRLIAEREREIRAFVPEEYWVVQGRFTFDLQKATNLSEAWAKFIGRVDDKGNGPTLADQNEWLAKHRSIRAELVEVDGKKAELSDAATALAIAERVGFRLVKKIVTEDAKAKGPARNPCRLEGTPDVQRPYRITKIDVKRTTSRPSAPFITSTMQQAASTRLSLSAQRTMRLAQQLYEGVDVPGRGTVGLITYMRTDSTHLSKEALGMVRGFIESQYGNAYLPEKPNFYTSSNKAAQEAHEAIRPTDVSIHPNEVDKVLDGPMARLYRLIWQRFVACQMTPAQFDATTVSISPENDTNVIFRASGRKLVFDGFYRVMGGPPTSSDEQTLPAECEVDRRLLPIDLAPLQKFTSPPPRYTEASLVKTLEEEGIGRPSTYAEIIQKIQDRKYVEQRERRFFATDLGEVVTDKLVEALPGILDVGFTREMELELDRVESGDLEWVTVLHHFYGPFRERLDKAHETLSHAKAEVQESAHTCGDCGAPAVYRFGRNGRFLSCSRYPECQYASPIDREGNPVTAEEVDVACPNCGSPMHKRSGRFGPFLGCSKYPECQGIVKLDKKERPIAPQPPALATDVPCPKCESPLNLRSGARGPWLSCSKFPKCRGRGAWTKLDAEQQKRWEQALEEHEKAHPIPVIRDLSGRPLTDAKGKPLEGTKSAEAGGASSSSSPRRRRGGGAAARGGVDDDGGGGDDSGTMSSLSDDAPFDVDDAADGDVSGAGAAAATANPRN